MHLDSIDSYRLPRMSISEFDKAFLHPKNPWMPLWWSAALPGLGHLCQGAYLRGLILMSWEIIVNFKAQLNTAILYTFTEDFARAQEAMDPGWALFYGAVFLFSMFDSYRIAVELNKLSLAEQLQQRRYYKPLKMSTLGINFIDRGNPWTAAGWSVLLPGFGHVYNNKTVKGLIILLWTVGIIHFAHINDAIIATFTGQFAEVNNIINYQWLLFFPSLYFFAIWDSYSDAVETNILFSEEIKNHLKKKYDVRG